MITYIIASVILIPHIKIEEIFPLNNIYDLLYLKSDIPNFDFIEFDGAVYRTFLSSILVALFTLPFKLFLDAKGITSFQIMLISNFSLLRYHFV